MRARWKESKRRIGCERQPARIIKASQPEERAVKTVPEGSRRLQSAEEQARERLGAVDKVKVEMEERVREQKV